MRYLRVGGTRQRHFAGTSLEPRNLPENAQTPTRRVHAVLARFLEWNDTYLSYMTLLTLSLGCALLLPLC